MGGSRQGAGVRGGHTAARPTLKDVAARAQVSNSTVSNVLNGRLQSVSRQTERRVRRAMEELNYHPNSSARALRSQANGILAFLLLDESEKYLADPLTNHIIAGVGDVLRERGWSLLIHTVMAGSAREQLFQPLLQRSVDGAFLLVSGSRENRRWYVNELTRMQQSFVVFDEVLDNATTMSVRAADRDAGRILTEHLLGKGHRRIAFIATGVATAVIEQRHLGYADALRAAGLAPDPGLLRLHGTWQPAGGAMMATELMALPEPPTAIICGHDVLAIGALHAVQNLGLAVPGEVAVAGFDDYAVSAWVRPTLTSVQLPGYQMGRTGATMLFDVCTGAEPPARQVVLPVELSARGST
ncbi:MAG: LacI family DNA-binding transcriptional regulator [Pseudonocardia sp.]|nr:LacI family DNA-binding transcriptional regulator [Pseudonocardia sp.]